MVSHHIDAERHSLYFSFLFYERLVAQVIDDYSSRSFRVLAVAAGKLHGLDQVDMSSAILQQLEGGCELHLLGLTVLSNHLRPESKVTISHLQDRLSPPFCSRADVPLSSAVGRCTPPLCSRQMYLAASSAGHGSQNCVMASSIVIVHGLS